MHIAPWTNDSNSTSGTLFFMRFHIPDTTSGFISLSISDALFDTGETDYSATSGGINVILPEYGDVDINGEIQITDALMSLAKKGRVIAYKFEGTRFDCGSLKGYLAANNFFAKKEGIY